MSNLGPKIEKELDIPEGLWQGQELSRIDISDLSDLNKRMPSGNEVGANELWIPGGKTNFRRGFRSCNGFIRSRHPKNFIPFLN